MSLRIPPKLFDEVMEIRGDRVHLSMTAIICELMTEGIKSRKSKEAAHV